MDGNLGVYLQAAQQLQGAAAAQGGLPAAAALVPLMQLQALVQSIGSVSGSVTPLTAAIPKTSPFSSLEAWRENFNQRHARVRPPPALHPLAHRAGDGISFRVLIKLYYVDDVLLQTVAQVQSHLQAVGSSSAMPGAGPLADFYLESYKGDPPSSLSQLPGAQGKPPEASGTLLSHSNGPAPQLWPGERRRACSAPDTCDPQGLSGHGRRIQDHDYKQSSLSLQGVTPLGLSCSLGEGAAAPAKELRGLTGSQPVPARCGAHCRLRATLPNPTATDPC